MRLGLRMRMHAPRSEDESLCHREIVLRMQYSIIQKLYIFYFICYNISGSHISHMQ